MCFRLITKNNSLDILNLTPEIECIHILNNNKK